YSPRGAVLQMERPPHTLALSDVSPQLAQLFQQAFERGSEAPDTRPTATQWLHALDEFRAGLRPCSNDPGHKIPTHHEQWLWCEFIANGGPNYFRGVAFVTVVFKFDGERLQALTKRIRRATANAKYERTGYVPRGPMVPHALPAKLN